MKIYFTAAIYQKDTFGPIYLRIVQELQKLGHTVQHEHITQQTLENIKHQDDTELMAYYKKNLTRISQAEIVVAEASFPSSLNIGHEITVAIDKSRPVVVLYRKGFDSFFLRGLKSEKIFLMEYEDDNLEQVVKDSIEFAKEQADIRFNFFISPKHEAYLDYIARQKKISRAVYLRQLIEKDRAQTPEYQPPE